MKITFKTCLLRMAIILAIFFLNIVGSNSQNCQKLVLPHDPANGYFNQDSVMVDTCSSDFEKKVYIIKNSLQIHFKDYVIHLSSYKPDSLIEITWEKIDTSFPIVRNIFSNLQQKFGIFYLRKTFPLDTFSNSEYSKYFFLRFDSYVYYDSLKAFFDTVSSVSVKLRENYYSINSVPNDPGMIAHGGLNIDNNDIIIQTRKSPMQWGLYRMNVPISWEIATGNQNIVISENETWWPSAIQKKEPFPLDQNLDPNLDRNNYYYPIPGGRKHEDIIKGSYGGNTHKTFFDVSANDVINSDGTSISFPLWDCYHNLAIIGIVSSQRNNSKGISGIAFNSPSIATGISPILDKWDWITDSQNSHGGRWMAQTHDIISLPNAIDVDGLQNGLLKTPHAIGKSYGMISSYGPPAYYYKLNDNKMYQNKNNVEMEIQDDENWEFIKSGSVLICASGNNLLDYNIPNEKLFGYPYMSGTSVFLNKDDPTMDINILRVGALYEGDQMCLNGASIINGNSINFVPNFNFSTLQFKFPTTSILDLVQSNTPNFLPFTNRWRLKTLASMDLVAPCQGLVGNMIDKSFNPNDINNPPISNHYWDGLNGSSYAVPCVTSVVALMRSVDEYLGITPTYSIIYKGQNQINKMTNGFLIQKKAYDILTFTADKIMDNGIVQNKTEQYYPNWESFLRTQDITTSNKEFFKLTFDYKSQTEDKLKRSWAMRMGFGMVNAFRAVLHAIPNNLTGVEYYKYIGNHTINKDTYGNDFNETHQISNDGNSIKILHLGSKVKTGSGRWEIPTSRVSNSQVGDIVNVLDWGGISLFNEIHNNQGVTKIDNSIFAVPENITLGIDGILSTDDMVNDSKILTTINSTGSGKILATGYLESVDLEGYCKLSHLDVNRYHLYDNPSGYGIYLSNKLTKLILKNDNQGNYSEIYGDINLYNNSKIEIPPDNSIAILPYGSINLKGLNDLILLGGNQTFAKIIMKTGSKLTGDFIYNAQRKVKLYNNSELMVESDANVDFYCPIEIFENGKLIINKNGKIFVDKIILHKDGILELKEGAQILPAEGKSGKIIIEPGAVLTINNPNPTDKTIAIIGGVEVKGTALPVQSGTPPLVTYSFVPVVGKLIVEEDAKLDIGPISSTTITEINIKKGAKVVLFAESLNPDGSSKDFGYGVSSNVIKGKFKIGIDGISTIKTEIKGFYGNNPYHCNSTDNFVHAKFKLLGSPFSQVGIPFYNNLDLKNSKFENVSINAFTYNVGNIENCDFVVDNNKFLTKILDNSNRLDSYKNLIKDYYKEKPNEILSVDDSYFIVPPGNFPGQFFAKNLNILNCSFKDNTNTNMTWLTWDKLSIPSETEPDYTKYIEYYNQFIARFIGISASGFNVVTIDNDKSGIGLTPLFQFNDLKDANGDPIDPDHFPDFTKLNDINHQHFFGLNTGIHTVDCGRVHINNSNFAYCRKAEFDNNTSVKFCGNTTFRVNTPHSLNNSKIWATFDNKFYQSNKAVNLISVPQGQNFRGNHFDDFYNGLFMDNSKAYLRGTEIGVTSTSYILGRNEFEILNPNNLLNEYDPAPSIRNTYNPFAVLDKYNPANQSRSDIYLKNYPSLSDFDGRYPIKIQCGYNKMGDYTPSHLFYEQPDPPLPVIHIIPDNNDWRPNNSIRYVAFNPTVPINQGDNRIRGCSETQTETICSIYVPLVQSCDFFARNTGIWATYAPEDTVINNMFYADLYDICQGEINCDCYRNKISDLMQLAVLGNPNLTKAKLQMVIDCINGKITGPQVAPYCDWDNLLLLQGEAYERLGLMDLGMNTYYNVMTNSHNPADTTLARWRIMNLEAIQADTTYGSVYDSLMSAYYQRVDRDITATNQVGTQPPPPPPLPRMVINEQDQTLPQSEDEKNSNKNEESALAILEQNSPNPFTNETVIVFRLNREADVRLGVHNALGHTIKEVVNQRLRKGKYVYTFQNENLATGVYLYLLTTDGKQIMKKMQLIK